MQPRAMKHGNIYIESCNLLFVVRRSLLRKQDSQGKDHTDNRHILLICLKFIFNIQVNEHKKILIQAADSKS